MTDSASGDDVRNEVGKALEPLWWMRQYLDDNSKEAQAFDDVHAFAQGLDEEGAAMTDSADQYLPDELVRAAVGVKAPIVAVGIGFDESEAGEEVVAVRRADGTIEFLAHEPETVAEALEDVHRRYCLTTLHDPVCRLLSEAFATQVQPAHSDDAVDGTAQQLMAEDSRKRADGGEGK